MRKPTTASHWRRGHTMYMLTSWCTPFVYLFTFACYLYYYILITDNSPHYDISWMYTLYFNDTHPCYPLLSLSPSQLPLLLAYLFSPYWPNELFRDALGLWVSDCLEEDGYFIGSYTNWRKSLSFPSKNVQRKKDRPQWKPLFLNDSVDGTIFSISCAENHSFWV